MTSISFLGPVGTFSEAALQQIINEKPVPALRSVEKIIPALTPQDALHMVREGRADFALVPTENFVDGPVTTTLDSLARGSRLQIFAEIEVPVAFSLLVKDGRPLSDVHLIGSHPIALTQVHGWLQEHLPQAETVATNSTAAAAEDVVRGRLDAAFAPARAGEILNLVSLADGVADIPDASTRFILVGTPATTTPRTGKDCTSVVFRLPNQPGTLVDAMNEFGLRGVDLSRIESRPTREKFGTYNFYIDCVGHIDDAAIAEALQALYRRAEWVRFLGSWPVSRNSGSTPPDFHKSQEWLENMRHGKEN